MPKKARKKADPHTVTAILMGAGGVFLLTTIITGNGIAFLGAVVLTGLSAWRLLRKFW